MPDPKKPVDASKIPVRPTEPTEPQTGGFGAFSGWTGFVLERRGGSGRLELRGRPAPDLDLELVPDAIQFDGPEPPTDGILDAPLAADLDGQIGTRVAGVAWRARMRWLDDGGR